MFTALTVSVDVFAVGELRDRPIGSELAVRAQMHRRFGAQPLEVGQHPVRFKKQWMCGIEVFERHGVGILVDVYGPLGRHLFVGFLKHFRLGQRLIFCVAH